MAILFKVGLTIILVTVMWSSDLVIRLIASSPVVPGQKLSPVVQFLVTFVDGPGIYFLAGTGIAIIWWNTVKELLN